MKPWVVTVALLGMFMSGCASGQQPQQPALLGGTWHWDDAQSDPLRRGGEELLEADVTLTIEYQEPVLKIERVVSSPQGAQTRHLLYSIDGQENTNRSLRGTQIRSRSRWHQGKLITEGRRTVNSPMGKMGLSLSETWTLSHDGQTLMIDTTTAAPGGFEIKHKEVFRKRG
jgi:hypothetical protein